MTVVGDPRGQATPLHTNDCHGLFAIWMLGASVVANSATNAMPITIEKARSDIIGSLPARDRTRLQMYGLGTERQWALSRLSDLRLGAEVRRAQCRVVRAGYSLPN
jgi:hypothetical protein